VYRTALGAATRGRQWLPEHLGPWTHCRTAPRIAPQTLHTLAKQQGFSDD
jgi:L-lactate dehydrogenase complex protein LldF